MTNAAVSSDGIYLKPYDVSFELNHWYNISFNLETAELIGDNYIVLFSEAGFKCSFRDLVITDTDTNESNCYNLGSLNIAEIKTFRDGQITYIGKLDDSAQYPQYPHVTVTLENPN